MFPSSTLQTLSYSQGTGEKEMVISATNQQNLTAPDYAKARISIALPLLYDRQAIYLNNKNIQKPNATFSLRF